MGETFTVTRGAHVRSGRPFITLTLIGLLVAILVVQAARLAWQGSTEAATAPPSQVAYFVVSWLLLVALIGSLVRLLAPFWQLAKARRSPADVVLALDASGLRMADSGCEIRAPWSSLAAVEVQTATASGFRLHVVASGPVQVSRDPLGRVMGRRLRHRGVNLRFTPDSPNRTELVAAIAHHSGGRFASTPHVPAPRRPADNASRVA